jgi:glucokinase
VLWGVLFVWGRARLIAVRVPAHAGIVTPALLEEAAEAGDAAAKEIYDTAVGYLALAVANQITVLNPARLLVGGGVLIHCHGMRQRIKEGIAKYTSETAAEHVVVTDAALGDDAGLIGAALLAA